MNSSVVTLKRTNSAGPKIVEMATSAASRPFAIAMRPIVPCAKIHRGQISWNSDIPEVTHAIPRRDVHASGRCNCEMGEVPAYAATFVMPLGSGTDTTRMLAEINTIMSVIANRLRPLPAAPNASKERPCKVRELFSCRSSDLAKRNGKMSLGNAPMFHCCAAGLTSSGKPLSATTNLLRTSNRPCKSCAYVAVKIEIVASAHAPEKCID